MAITAPLVLAREIFMKYMGGKGRIAPFIINYINNVVFCEHIDTYYEPFMGGCAVGELVSAKNRYLSDNNRYLVALMQHARDVEEPFEYITEDKWYEIKLNKDNFPDWLVGWAGVACSFRGNYFAAFGGEYTDKTTGNTVNPQLQCYNSFIQERKLFKGIDFSCHSYNEIGEPVHSIIYCDAPYRNTHTYRYNEKFDFSKYDEWLIKMSLNNLVIISEYSMVGENEERFIELDNWVLNKNIGAGQTDNEQSIERLYYVSGGYLTDKYFSNKIEEF